MTDEPRLEQEESASLIEETLETPAAEMGDQEEQPPLHQTVEMRDGGPGKKYIKVSIDREDIQSRLNQKYSELRVEANVPGFRPGKTPRKIIERRFAKDVEGQVKGEVLLQSLEQLAEEHDVAPLSTPNLDP